MIVREIIARRLLNQQIAETKFTKPEEIVSCLGAMQSQDWHMAKWAIGLRLPGSNDQDIEKAFNEGKILRTHMLRPTWHFVTPADIRWMQQLTSPRVHAFNSGYYRKHDLDQKIFKKCNSILIKVLRDHNYLTRTEVNNIFSKAKIKLDNLQLSYIMMNAELESIICSGPRKGKQFTYALLDEKSPAAKAFRKEDALHKLTSLYFKTRGPATISDYTWWSGLTVKEAKEGISSLDKNFLHETINEKEYIYSDEPVRDISKLQTTFLVPDFDEYGISYKDRSLYIHPIKKDGAQTSAYYVNAVAIDGYFGGNWGRPTSKNQSMIDLKPLSTLTKKQLASLDKAVKRYLNFWK